MCIAFWLLDEHPAFWLILALNRDEFHARPTLPFHFWRDDDDVEGGDGRGRILAGRDLRSGGTWMGLTKAGGRLAFLTNVREKGWDDRPEGRSRGELPTRFLSGDRPPREFADIVMLEAHLYNGFNLVLADFARGEMAFVSNRHGDGDGEGAVTATADRTVVRLLLPGLHSVSNGTLDSAWPKMERGKRLFADVVVAPAAVDGGDCAVDNERIVATVLRDGERASDVSAQVRETNCGEEFEAPLSSIFVENTTDGVAYGTRSMTVVGIRRDGRVSLFERYLEAGEWKDHSFQFQADEGQSQPY